MHSWNIEKLYETMVQGHKVPLPTRLKVINEQSDSPSEGLIEDRTRKALDLGEDEKIPTCNTPLKLGDDFNLDGEDERIWRRLYSILPLRKGSDSPSAGAGKGEIATYWAFKYNVNKHNVIDSRKGENPDLTINGVGCEIKSYTTNDIALGKWYGDTENVNLLNKLFGLLALFSELDADNTIKTNTGNFKARDVVTAFNIMSTFEETESLKNINLFKPLYAHINSIYSKLDLPKNTSAEAGAAKLIRRVLYNKLYKKPRMEKERGYILNVSERGVGKFYLINDDTVKKIDDERILDGVSVKQAELTLNFKTLFG
jgi:hypothetical protein